MADITPAERLLSGALLRPGWYRVTGKDWTWLASPDTPSRDLPDDPFELVLIEDNAEDVPLW